MLSSAKLMPLHINAYKLTFQMKRNKQIILLTKTQAIILEPQGTQPLTRMGTDTLMYSGKLSPSQALGIVARQSWRLSWALSAAPSFPHSIPCAPPAEAELQNGSFHCMGEKAWPAQASEGSLCTVSLVSASPDCILADVGSERCQQGFLVAGSRWQFLQKEIPTAGSHPCPLGQKLSRKQFALAQIISSLREGTVQADLWSQKGWTRFQTPQSQIRRGKGFSRGSFRAHLRNVSLNPH